MQITGTHAHDGPSDLVAALCTEVLLRMRPDGLSAIGISRASSGEPATIVFASNPLARLLKELAITLGEGPSVDALFLSGPVLIPDLETASGLSSVAFAREAVALGVRAVFAFPLQIGAIMLGTLTVSGPNPVALSVHNLAELLRLADKLALILLAPEVTWPVTDDWAVPLLEARHESTQQAIGMVSVQLGSTLVAASAVLRAHAYAEDRGLVDLSRDVVARRVRFGPQGVIEVGPAGADGTPTGDDVPAEEGDNPQ